MKLARLISIASLSIAAIVFASFAPASPRKSKSTTSSAWKKIGSKSGGALNSGTLLEIKPSMQHWRFSLETSVSENAGASAGGANVRIALMTCIHADPEGKPHDWEQIAAIYQGKPGGVFTRELFNGLDKNGASHWYAIQIVGQLTHYKLLAEQIDDSASTQPAEGDADNVDSKPKHSKKG